MTHDCEYVLCGKPFETKRKDARFCSDLHRALSNQLRHKRESSALATLLFRASQAENQFDVATSNPDVKRARDTVLRAAYDAIAAELGIVLEQAHETPVDELDDVQNEPENDAVQDPLTPELVREKLRAFMAKTGFGQTRIANLVRSNQPTISQFLNGKMVPAEHVRRAILDLVIQDHGLDRR